MKPNNPLITTPQMIATFDQVLKESLGNKIGEMTPFSDEWYQTAQAIGRLLRTVEDVNRSIQAKFAERVIFPRTFPEAPLDNDVG